jgi:hypothetical protein
MSSESPLKGKSILIVDDEPDVLDTVAEELDMCLVDKAGDYNTAMQFLASYTYDVVILDIMGVNGFDLLQNAVDRGFKKAIKLGAVSFLPKDKMSELRPFLEDVVLGGGKPVWKRFFETLGAYFNKRFGPDWVEKDKFFKEFKEEVLKQA